VIITLLLILFFIISCLLLVGLILVITSTCRRKGKWGINLTDVVCPKCGQALPKIRKPVNLRQFLWGGTTCSNCGAEVDKWGNEIKGCEGRP
jgi:ssDNA-binding Zn-finger/Zn-ribbon topoisomerase 1